LYVLFQAKVYINICLTDLRSSFFDILDRY